MAKKPQKSPAELAPATNDAPANDAQANDAPAAPAAPEVHGAPVPRVAAMPQAREINFARSLVSAEEEAAAAQVVKTAKGTNPTKTRVYGYDNGVQGGGVPKGATVVIVPGAKPPAGVTSGQWLQLSGLGGKTVQSVYDAGVASRSVRRAYRAGAIRFMGA